MTFFETLLNDLHNMVTPPPSRFIKYHAWCPEIENYSLFFVDREENKTYENKEKEINNVLPFRKVKRAFKRD